MGWEAWDKAAKPPVVKDHSFNIMTSRINEHRKFNTGKSYQTCIAWKTINSKHLREWTSQHNQQPQALNGGKEQLYQLISPCPPPFRPHKPLTHYFLSSQALPPSLPLNYIISQPHSTPLATNLNR